MDKNKSNFEDLNIAEDAALACNSRAVADYETARRIMDSINAEQARRKVSFGDTVVPTLLRPNFISASQTEALRKVTVTIMNALEKVIRIYFKDNSLHGILKLNETEKEIVSIDPGYERVVVKARLDAFMNGASLKFIEFNCDSPAGAGYGEVQNEIFSETELMKPLTEKYNLEWPKRCRMMHSALVKSYRDFGGKEEHPHIAITDWRDVKTISEFYLLKDLFDSLGTPTTVADPRDFEISGGRLCINGKPVDMVYRRVIIREVLEKMDEVKPFLEAYRKGLVCVANPFRSKVVSNKCTLSVLTDPKFDFLFTDEENEVKRRHIPWTRNMTPEKVIFEDKEYDIFKLAETQKNDFVAKPADSYGGADVHIGREETVSAWNDVLEDAASGRRVWVLQKYVDIPEEDFPIFSDNGITIEKRKVNLNPFAIGGEYAGCLSRISISPIINVSAGGGLVPTFSISKIQ